VTGSEPYATEYQHMLKSEKRITPRTTLRESDWPKDPAKRISCNPLRCGGMGGLEVYHSASQSVDGCMYTARSSAAESFREGGGKDMILRSANTAGYELTKTIKSSYVTLASIESGATPIKDTFIFYNNNYYHILNVVLADNRVVAFVQLVKSQQLGFEAAF